VVVSLVVVSHALCPYVQRAVIALTEKRVPFERVDIDLDDKPAWFTAISPLGKTPLLRVGDAVIFESAVICEYLEETLPHPLHPADALERARHRGFMEFGSAMLGDVWGLEIATDAAGVQRKVEELRRKVAWLERNLGPGPYFAGDAFSLVDAVFGPVFRYFDVFDRITDLGVFEEAPRVRAWRAALARRASVRDAVGADYESRLLAFLAAKGAHLSALSAEKARVR
jgi:glutathione S-transferase